MKSKHTSGEWVIALHGKRVSILDTNITIVEISREFKTIDESFANAYLIASAPKLLKHLRIMHTCYAKGIQPSIGTLKEIESLINKL